MSFSTASGDLQTSEANFAECPISPTLGIGSPGSNIRAATAAAVSSMQRLSEYRYTSATSPLEFSGATPMFKTLSAPFRMAFKFPPHVSQREWEEEFAWPPNNRPPYPPLGQRVFRATLSYAAAVAIVLIVLQLFTPFPVISWLASVMAR